MAAENSYNVLTKLESHSVVLEAELREILDDIDSVSIMTRKYGSAYFAEPLHHLTRLKESKERQLRNIVDQVDNFNNSIVHSKSLLRNIEVGGPAPPPPAPSSTVVYNEPAHVRTTVGASPVRVLTNSPILANSPNRRASPTGYTPSNVY